MISPLEQLPVLKIKVRKSGTQEFGEVLVDGDYDGEYFSSLPLRIVPNGYVQVVMPEYTDEVLRTGILRRVPEKRYKYLHHFVLPPKKGYWTWFKNRNKLDCRSANLEYIRPRDSAVRRIQGRWAQSGGYLTSIPYRGVILSSYKHRGGPRIVSKGRFVATCAGKNVGTYGSAEEAALAYDKAARKRWGDNARLNFPPIPGMNYCRKCYKPVAQPEVYHKECLKTRGRGEI